MWIQYNVAWFFYFLHFIFLNSCDGQQQHRPIVGILSQPHEDGNSFYIAASYVKWLESGGAQSIPIPYDANETMIREIFSQINGVFFPGGSAKLPQSAMILWELILENNQEGQYFPVWGTCLGFEFMLMLAAGEDESLLQKGLNAGM